ncbi:ester hydrolase C11orf54 homolog isoform X1 [Patella vulgata]|uniref:ester hydrolase C11orf54 homolog isoform X1 n=1 Tax=Patella vulgata TaxID=6465 RepID=UPI0021804838|nr:ester hydrolase C11orf54 homolog isoform X1 [Patella vulgata]
MSSRFTVTNKKAALHVPSLEEAAKVLEDGLKRNFANVSVSVVDCPDLTQKPFNLASPGICGSERLADIGGPPYLAPLPQKDKVYDVGKVAEAVGLPGAFVIGAGAGPWEVVGVNSELICDVKLDVNGNQDPVKKSYIAKLGDQLTDYKLEKLPNSTEFCLMANLLCSEGKSGKVLEVKASKRTGQENFMSSMRKTLDEHYNDKAVGLGGVFLIESGKATLHIMQPDFSDRPLKEGGDIDNWLQYFDMDAPLVCLGELVSHDVNLDLRLEHFHCFSDHGQGGHYHYDTTPDTVSYRGYFTIPDAVYRLDQPQ